MMTYLRNIKAFLLAYIVLGGFGFYLLGTAADIIFIPTIDMQGETWCKKWVENTIRFSTHRECVAFKSRVDALKYAHNQRMQKRQQNKTFGLFACAAVLTYSLMLFNPSRFFGKNALISSHAGGIAIAIYFGVVIGFVLPVAFQALLPRPETWFPAEFFEIRQARVELIVRAILEKAEILARHSPSG